MLIEWFAKLWSVGVNPPPKADLICLVSFGATRTGLTNGLKNVVRLGLKLQGMFPGAKVVFGEFTGNPIPGLEMDLKMILFRNALYVGQVISTIEEAEKWRASLPSNFLFPNVSVVIVTDEMHSRSARRVSNHVWNGPWYTRLWRWFFGLPLVQVCVVTFQTKDSIDPESPTIALRNEKLWVRNNILRELFLMFVPFGYSIMRKLNVHQPTVKD